jgi:hypothetical protein
VSLDPVCRLQLQFLHYIDGREIMLEGGGPAPGHPASPPAPDEVLYVACGQTGLADAPSDFLLAIDLRDGVEHRALNELHFDTPGEEIRSLHWLDNTRSRLAVLGTGCRRSCRRPTCWPRPAGRGRRSPSR